jgi:steroid delta-isomerase-like uncharacterized protein
MTDTDTRTERIVREFVAWENGDASKRDVVSESLDAHNPGLDDGEVHDRESYAAYLEAGRSAFPDMEITVEEIVTAGEIAMAEVRITGTHEGPLDGLPPTGRSVDIRGVGKFVVDDGTVEACYLYYDSREMATQLGVTFPEILGHLPKLAWRKVKTLG